ncbi:MAG: methylmalonyl-CoA mutase [Desulfobacterales bacterium]|nr:methylmalonyl-CoA mutase [Desulfobacterales bacterium]
MTAKQIRILIAKPDLDGHDRGAKVVALALRDAGMEVVYSGLHQNVDRIISAAVKASVDIIGLSIMTGGHIPICTRLLGRMKEEQLDDIHVIVGGVIPKQDIAALEAMGVKGVFPGGTPFDEIVSGITSLV